MFEEVASLGLAAEIACRGYDKPPTVDVDPSTMQKSLGGGANLPGTKRHPDPLNGVRRKLGREQVESLLAATA